MNDNISQLIEILKKSGIDTTNMSEEEIRKVASTIKDDVNKDIKSSQESLRQRIKDINSGAKPGAFRRVSASSSMPTQSHNTSSNGNNSPTQHGMPQNKDHGLNYTDNNNPHSEQPKTNNIPNSNSTPRPTNNSQAAPRKNEDVRGNPQVNKPAQTNAPSRTGTPVNNPQGSSAKPSSDGAFTKKGGLDQEKNNPGKAEGIKGNQVSQVGQTNQIPVQDSPKSMANSALGDFKEGADITEQTPQGNTRGTSKASLESLKNPTFDFNGMLRKPIKANPQGPSVPPAVSAPPKVQAESEKKETKSLGSYSSQAVKRPVRSPKATSPVTDSKIRQAQKRLEQNGVSNKRTPPKKIPVNAQAIPTTAGSVVDVASGLPDRQRIGESSSGIKNKPSLVDKLRQRINGSFNRNREVEDTYNDPQNLSGGIKNKAKDEVKKKIKNKIRLWIVAHLPAILIALGITLLIIFIIMLLCIILMGALPDVIGIDGATNNMAANASSSTDSKTTCTYGASSNLGQSSITNVRVELINCDGTSSNYRVLETVDFEKYVLGVALAEIGEGVSDEALKTQIVLARTFSLSRNKGMCPSDPDNCFYGYNKNSNIIRMRACENDQVYWDYDKNIYRANRGSVSLYSPEVNSGAVWKNALQADRKQHVESVAASIKGEVLLDSSGNPQVVSYGSLKQDTIKKEADAGKSYKEILEIVTGTSPSSDKNCQQGSVDYNNYQLNTDNSRILNEPLGTFLTSKGSSIDEFNNLIQSNVQKAGSGTREGVVTAAVTLIGELANKYSIKLPYFYGGGHSGDLNLADSNWGSNTCHTHANNRDYNQCGLDCSGLIGWAIYNGGFKNVTSTASGYVNISGATDVNLGSSSILQPGDLLYNNDHVILIIGVDNSSNQYICAEAVGKEAGVIFSRHSYSGDNGKYKGVDLSGFYENDANKR